jgi:hydrogenase maturation protein HypF
MGRLIDAVACILGIKPVMQYEGEAAMLLEALANKSPYPSYDSYHLPFHNGIIDWRPLIQEIIHDWLQKEPNELIAWKFFYSLAKAISAISSHYFIDKLAFSGGVFQNVLLTDMVIEILQHKRHLYFHQQLSPNDECIGFGQLAWYSRFSKKEFNDKKMSTQFNSSSIKEPHFLNQ